MGQRGPEKRFDAGEIRLRADRALKAKLDEIRGESTRSDMVRALINEAHENYQWAMARIDGDATT